LAGTKEAIAVVTTEASWREKGLTGTGTANGFLDTAGDASRIHFELTTIHLSRARTPATRRCIVYPGHPRHRITAAETVLSVPGSQEMNRGKRSSERMRE